MFTTDIASRSLTDITRAGIQISCTNETLAVLCRAYDEAPPGDVPVQTLLTLLDESIAAADFIDKELDFLKTTLGDIDSQYRLNAAVTRETMQNLRDRLLADHSEAAAEQGDCGDDEEVSPDEE